MKYILRESNIKRELNDKTLNYFIEYGFVPLSDTLVKDVSKIKSGYYLTVSTKKGAINQLKFNMKYEDITEAVAKKRYVSNLESEIMDNINECDVINLAHSTGYDSNFLLYLIRKNSDRVINTFSIGGKKGINETNAAQKMSSHYDDVNANISMIDQNSLQYFTDIVWKLEGAVYENGVFLQYELGKIISNTTSKTFICGEGADEINNINFYNEEETHPDNYTWKGNPYEVLCYRILKKSALIMNSFSVEIFRPFTSYRFINISRQLRLLNGKTKNYHKEVVLNEVDPYICNQLLRKGGATGNSALFSDNYSYNELVDFCENSSFFDQRFSEVKLFESQKDPSEFYLGMMYIYLFYQLFLSGNYDDRFQERDFDIRLDNILT